MKEALRKLREMYPGEPLDTVLNYILHDIELLRGENKELKRERDNAILDKYEYDRRYCDILVEKRKLTEKVGKLKAQLNTIYGQSIHAQYIKNAAESLADLIYEIAKTDPTRVAWETKTFIFKWPYTEDFEGQLANFIEDLKNNKAAEILKISRGIDVEGAPYAVLMFKLPVGFKEENYVNVRN